MNFRPARGLLVAHAVRIERGLAASVAASAYPWAGTLLAEGLMPGRHYHLRGAEHRFCRADAAGMALIELALSEPAELVLVPVV